MNLTIRQMVDALGADFAGHRALRKAAQIGLLLNGRRVDAKGTQTFPRIELFRAALHLALARAALHGEVSARLAQMADERWFGGDFDLLGAVKGVGGDIQVQFRVITTGSGAAPHQAVFARAESPMPADAESVLVVNLNRVFAPAFDFLKSLPRASE